MAVYDYIWTVEDPLAGSTAPSEPLREGAPPPERETSTYVAIYILFLSGLKQRYRHFLRQTDGAIIEVGYQHIVCIFVSKNVFLFCSIQLYEIGSEIKCNSFCSMNVYFQNQYAALIIQP